MYIDAQGTVIKKGDGASPEVFTAIPQVTSIDPPASERSQRETTDLDASARTYKSGLIDHQDMTLQLEWDERNTVHAGLRTDFDNNTERNWQIVDTGSPEKTYNLTGSLTRVDIDPYAVDGIVTATAVMKPSGPMTVS